MKGRMVFGALLLSAALTSQGFGFELLGNLLGLNCGCGGCNACQACAPASCEPAPETCAPEPACSDPCARRCDLFSGLKGLFACNRCCDSGCNDCAEPACEPAACAPEPSCKLCNLGILGRGCGCRPACEPACDPAPEPACEPACAPRPRKHCRKACRPACRPACEPACEPACDPCGRRRCFADGLFGLLDGLFACGGCNACAQTGCGDPSCCGPALEGAPVEVPPEEAAPLPIAPRADPSASLMPSRSLYQTGRIVSY